VFKVYKLLKRSIFQFAKKAAGLFMSKLFRIYLIMQPVPSEHF